MGKGKRNRQLHFEDKQANPQKYRERKKQRVMPSWAKRTIAIALAVLLVAGIVLGALINSGLFLRNRILVKSATGENDLNQQMATFLLWQTMYQQAYYEWYYTSWGLYEDEYGITTTYSSAASYGIAVASTYTKELLHDGIESIADYLIELVAGADAATKANLTLNDADMKDVEEIKTWIKNVYLSSGYMGTYKKFLKEMVGDGITVRDVEDAAKLVVLYTKYCNYAKLNLDNDPTLDVLQAFIEKNPAGHFKVSYQQYKNADPEFLVELFRGALADKYESEYKDLVTEDEYEQILKDLVKAKNTTENKSADDLAAELYNKLTAKESTPWADAVADLTVENKTVTKPGEDDEADAFQSVLFGEDKISVDDSLQSNDDGTSYVIKVTGGSAKDGWEIAYVTFTDSDYYKVFRAATEEIKELSVDADTFREMVVNNVVDKNFKSLVINKFLTLGVVKEAQTKLNDAYLTDAELDTLVQTLAITGTEYSSENKAEIPAEIADYIFDTSRKDSDTKVIESAGKYYIVNVFTKPTEKDIEGDPNNGTVCTVKAGWAEYDYKLPALLADMEIKQYIKNAQDPLTVKYPEIAEWAYSADRAAGDSKIFKDDTTFYVAYLESPVSDVTVGVETLKSVKVAIKAYEKTSEDTPLVDALGYKATTYKDNDVKMPAEIKAWLFDDARVEGDAQLIKVVDGTNVTFYLAYAFGAPTVDGEDKSVEAYYTSITLTSKQYVNNGEDPLATDFSSIATWAYNDKRTAGNTTIVTIDETVYLVYMNKPLTSTTLSEGGDSYSYVSIAMVPYTLADAPDSEWILGQKGQLVSDLIKDENTTDYKSADDKADALYQLLAGENGDKTRWDELVADLEVRNDTVKKPASESATTTAVQDVLYAGDKVEVGNIYKVNDNGTSYVLKITEVDGTTYKYDYVTYTDDEYYEFFRGLKSALTSSFAKDPTDLSYPDSLSTATNVWLFAGEYDEETEKYTFEREVNDVMHFAVTTTSSSSSTPTETGYYNVYIVTTAPVQDKDDEKVVYGGYLMFKTKAEADEAKKGLSGLKGFDLWHAFAALSVTEGEGDSATVTNSTIDTSFTKDDIKDDAVETWLFADERKSGNVSVIKGTDGYYLVYYYTAEEAWTRKAKDSWVSEQMEEKLASLSKNYSLDEKAMSKIKKPEEETTTAAKK
ncbi:MAG: hypothetical protein IJW49_11835 [Clostridia bacterium]|nr:hypothetical protein [Clostridia bacterium]MBQ9807179.1 hypothetical protein [Clostridia bacterium]